MKATCDHGIGMDHPDQYGGTPSQIVRISNMGDEPIHCFDRRSFTMTHFNHCPWCGEKLDWRKLREMRRVAGGYQ